MKNKNISNREDKTSTCSSCGKAYLPSSEEKLVASLLYDGVYCPACRQYIGYGLVRCGLCNNRIDHGDEIYIDGNAYHKKCSGIND